MTTPLPSWRDTTTRATILDFVAAVSDEGHPDHVPPAERVAVFDNDGTLWCEQPVAIQVVYVLDRLAALAEHDASRRDRQPWKAAHERDIGWFEHAVTAHSRGDDTGLDLIIGAAEQAFGEMSVEDYEAAAHAFLDAARHPTLDRPYLECTYQPARELLDHLTAHGFTTYIVSGGDRDFMRPVTTRLYDIPPERVVGSTFALEYRTEVDGRGAILYKAKLGFFDDGPEKPVRIWTRVGRRPILAMGNSNGDVEMLHFTGAPDRRGLRLLVRHDDAEREFAYADGAEHAFDEASRHGWTVVSIRDDWATVFGPT